MTLKTRLKIMLLNFRIATLHDRVADLDHASGVLLERSRQFSREAEGLLIEAQSLRRDINRLEHERALPSREQTKSNKPDAPYKLEK